MSDQPDATPPESSPTVPPATRYRPPVLFGLAVVLLAVGIGLALFAEGDEASAVRVASTGIALPQLMGTPDYYVVLALDDDTKIQTETKNNMPMGSGLTFELPAAVPLAVVKQVVLYDDNLLADDLLDHAEPDGRKFNGQSHSFELIGADSQWKMVGWALAALAGLYLVYAAIHFVRTHTL